MTTNCKHVSAVLAELGRVINAKDALPILTSIRVQMSATGEVKMTAKRGSEMSMTKTLHASRFTGEGEFVADYEQLSCALKGLAEQDVTMQFDKGSLTIAYMGGSLTFVTGDATKYPKDTARTDAKAEMYLTGKTLVDSLKAVKYACAKDETRMVMTGVCMEKKGDRLTFVGTDGRLLRWVDTKTDAQCADFEAVLPTTLVNILCSGLKDGNQVHLSVNTDFVYIDWADTTLDCKRVEGKYPNYRGIVDAVKTPVSMQCERKALLSSFSRVATFANQASQLIVCEYADGSLVLKGEDSDIFGRSMTERVQSTLHTADGYKGEAIKFGVSAKWMTLLLANTEGESITLKYNDCESPIVVVGDGSTSIIMPMNINAESKPKTAPKPKAEAKPKAETKPVETKPVEAKTEAKAKPKAEAKTEAKVA